MSRFRPIAAYCPTSGSVTAATWSMPGLSADGAATKLRGVTLYDREGGAIARVIEAERAEQVPGGWRLDNVRTYDARMNIVMQASSMMR